ncbi:hypothetical protein K402DRAFT_451466 [Aulographum hederae CBS 113979]|uniref:Uncharacterized protein n=1 Tax=Aulographum hederae CBS 113979 TaxID=1176131 RepID=A0A6G1HBC5_9PEZI|nr:hypothetical protein K402DRAFT_451466 [Aulographum hederae CBS 113979]
MAAPNGHRNSTENDADHVTKIGTKYNSTTNRQIQSVRIINTDTTPPQVIYSAYPRRNLIQFSALAKTQLESKQGRFDPRSEAYNTVELNTSAIPRHLRWVLGFLKTVKAHELGPQKMRVYPPKVVNFKDLVGIYQAYLGLGLVMEPRNIRGALYHAIRFDDALKDQGKKPLTIPEIELICSRLPPKDPVVLQLLRTLWWDYTEDVLSVEEYASLEDFMEVNDELWKFYEEARVEWRAKGGGLRYRRVKKAQASAVRQNLDPNNQKIFPALPATSK